MKLPEGILNYEQSYQNLELKFSKKTIKIRKYLTKEIRTFLNATSTVNDDNVWNYETFKLFKACVHPDDYETVDSLGKADFLFALSYLRSISYDPTIARPHSCPHCSWWIDGYTISVIDHIKTEPEVIETEFSYNLENGTIVTFNVLPYMKELEIIRDTKEGEYFSAAHNILINSIDKLIIDDVAYEDVDLEDIKQFVDNNITPNDYSKVLEFLASKKINFWLQDDKVCPNCKKDYKVVVDEPHFFVQV